MKKLFSYLLAFTPGSIPFMYGDFKKSIAIFGSFLIFGWIYRLSGFFGPFYFFIFFLLMLALYIGITIFQIKSIKNTFAVKQLLKGFIFCICVIFLTKVFLRHLSPGNTYSTATNESMSPIIAKDEFVYVTKFVKDIQFGDIVVYQFQDYSFLGIICGVSGDLVAVQDLNIIRNKSVTNCGFKEFMRVHPTTMPETIVPTESYFIIKPNGQDSSFLAHFFAKSDIKGKVLFNINNVPFSFLIRPIFKLFDY